MLFWFAVFWSLLLVALWAVDWPVWPLPVVLAGVWLLTGGVVAPGAVLLAALELGLLSGVVDVAGACVLWLMLSELEGVVAVALWLVVLVLDVEDCVLTSFWLVLEVWAPVLLAAWFAHASETLSTDETVIDPSLACTPWIRTSWP